MELCFVESGEVMQGIIFNAEKRMNKINELNKYVCPDCLEGFRSKTNYDRHLTKCEVAKEKSFRKSIVPIDEPTIEPMEKI